MAVALYYTLGLYNAFYIIIVTRDNITSNSILARVIMIDGFCFILFGLF